MKIEALILLLAIAMAFLSGSNFFSQPAEDHSPITQLQIQQAIHNFEKQHRPLTELRPLNYATVINPSNLLPYFHQIDDNTLLAFKKFQQTCRLTLAPSQEPRIVKLWQWQSHQCGKPLPTDFYSLPPYFHPSGQSYASLKKNPAHWKYAHVTELSELIKTALPSPYHELSTLTWQELFDLWEEQAIIESTEFVLLKKTGEKDSYQIFPRPLWNSYWLSAPLSPKPLVKGTPCNEAYGRCWVSAPSTFDKKQVFLFMLYLSVLVTALLIWLLFRRIKLRDEDGKRLKFSLEMLAHEIRTPVTNLAINVEVLREDFDRQAPKNQTSILRLFDQVERLKRIANSSQNYLSNEKKKHLVPVDLAALIENTLDPFRDDIELTLQLTKPQVYTDGFWASICVKNVVENALKHGQKPVKVNVSSNHDEWSVTVTDQGQFAEKMSNSGMGLGLKLVREILPELGGSLELKHNPTQAMLKFRSGQ